MIDVLNQPLENVTKAYTTRLQINSTPLSFEFFKYAPRADMAVMGHMGDTSVLVTIVCSDKQSDLDYFPLQVEYIERLYAGGKIKGSRFIKREGRPSDEAVLVARMIDRSIRPLFPKDFKNEVQIIATVMSVDGENDPAILANLTTQLALHVSDIPWQGPSLAMRVGMVDDQLIFNPTLDQFKEGQLDLIISATPNAVVMIEAGAHQVDNPTIVNGIKLFYDKTKPLFELADKLRQDIGLPKRDYQATSLNPEAIKFASQKTKDIAQFIKDIANQKKTLDDWNNTKTQWVKNLSETHEDPDFVTDYDQSLSDIFADQARHHILTTGQRLDGRNPDQIRPLHIEVGLLPQVHGSALFQRGETQVLSILTLASPAQEQIIETMLEDEFKRYMHHYSALPYSVGETGRIGWPKRREIGHGALAEKALLPVLPSEDDFPYTIRIVSEVLSQQGSTSMASTCGSTLSLMDAGVPIKAPVAGISIGMVSDDKGNYRLLTDIMGIEDHTGDMDFKVTGTKDGITAIQLDVKKIHLNLDMITQILEKAKEARLTILDNMAQIISEPRPHLSPKAPKIAVTYIPEDKIGEVIGSGGQTIKRIINDTDTMIDIKDDGRVVVSGESQANVQKAIETIEGITRELQPGEEFVGKIMRLTNFGAFIEIYPGKEALLHISKIPGFVKDITKILKVGQKIKVRVDEVSPDGRVSLALAAPIPGYTPTPSRRPQTRPTPPHRPPRSLKRHF